MNPNPNVLIGWRTFFFTWFSFENAAGMGPIFGENEENISGNEDKKRSKA